MIKITSLNKYYNKGKTNELHVINNVSLELNDYGLIAFLGKSGSGKTTLLNVIGGLDKQDSGTISYDYELYDKYNMQKIDLYRKENIGYIFQNYLLLNNMTVTDNLKEALEIIGINNKEEQKKRIEYALKIVGLYKYRKKLVSNLSGGEMQRVSIARSLIKNCKLIIADEPTGNLDRENTLEIMNILKKISKTTLVLLVTHNEEMAEAFADRIIKIKDGTIIDDYINEKNGTIQDKNKNKIYLKDLNHQTFSTENISIDIYKEIDKNINLKLYIKNDTIYLQTDYKVNNPNDSEIHLIDDHYHEEIKIDNQNYQFDISWYNNQKEKHFWKNIKNSLKSSWNHFKNTTKKGKIFYFIFFLIGIIMASCAINYAKYCNKDNDFENVDAYVIYQNGYTLSEYPNISGLNQNQLIANDYIEDIFAYNIFSIYFEKNLNSSIKASCTIDTHFYPLSLLSNKKLITGRNPIYQNEILITKNIANKIIEEELLDNYDDLIDQTINDFIITGVVNNNNQAFYIPDLYYLNTIIKQYEIKIENKKTPNSIFYIGGQNEFDYEITKGTNNLTSDDEILIIDELAKYYHLNIGDIIEFNSLENTIQKNYKIVGIFKTSNQALNEKTKYGFITNDISLKIYNVDVTKSNQENFTDFKISLNTDYYNILNDKYLVMNLEDIKDNPIYNFKITSGTEPKKDNEILINEHYEIKIGKTITINKQKYKIVGTYQVKNGLEHLAYLITNDKTYLQLLANWVDVFIYEYGEFIPSYQIKNIDKIKEYLTENEFLIKSVYDYQYTLEEINNRNDKKSVLITTIILALISIVYIYFSTRASIFSEIKSIGVYRSIGKTRIQIIKTYISDIFVKTSMTSLLGYIITIGIVIYFNLNVKSVLGTTLISINIGIYLLGIILLYIINILVGLIPVLRLMKNTPSEINSKYDV